MSGSTKHNTVTRHDRVDVSIKVMTAVWQHSQARSEDLSVALAIADFSNDEGLAFPPIQILAKKARLSPRQVKRAHQELQRLRELDIFKNRGPQGGNREDYERRYHVDPIRNAKVNGNLARLVDCLGAENAPKVAAYYLGCADPFYLKVVHSTEILLRDCEGLHTQCVTGRRAATRPTSVVGLL
jgi:hypothetical protein